MKKIISILIVIILVISCSEDLKKITKTETKSIDTANLKMWPAIDIKVWEKTPALNDRVANEDDVKKGLAVFNIDTRGGFHSAYNMELPKLAYLKDSETKTEVLVVVIQVEVTAKNTVVGYRNIAGGNGACLLHEIKFLDDETVKKVVGQ